MSASINAVNQVGGEGVSDYGYGAMGNLKYWLHENSRDVNLLFVGDSTLNDTNEWSHFFAEDRAAEFPEFTVVWHQWGAVSYNAGVTIQVGTGPHTFHVWNLAVTGATISTFMGSIFAAAIGALTLDAIGISTGLNSTGLGDSILRGRLVGGMEQIMLAHEGVPVFVVQENPFQPTEAMTQVVNMWGTIAADRTDVQVIPIHKRFIDAGKPLAWYADSTHPNSVGQQVCRAVVNQEWARSPAVPFVSDPAWIDTVGVNLIPNGDFAAWTGSIPTGFTQSGNGVFTRETGLVFPGRTDSLKIVNGSTTTSISRSNLDAIPHRGLRMTLRARMYIQTNAANSNAGRLRYITNSAGFPLIAQNPGANGLGGWREVMISDHEVPMDATTFGFFLYPHSTASSVGEIYIDSVMLNVGRIPRGAY